MTPNNRKVAILACLSSLNPNYSIAGIVHDQLDLLAKHENLVFITSDDFKDQHLVPKGVEIRYYTRSNESMDPEKLDIGKFEQYINATGIKLKELLKDCTHVIQHDLLFIHEYAFMNWSIRKCAELLPNLKWLHWQHSAPSRRPLDCAYPFTGCYMGMNNSTFVYLNRTDIPEVAQRYSIPENQIALVHNFLDFDKMFRLHPLTKEIIQSQNLYKADTLCIYPTRLTEAKQIDKAIQLIEQLKVKGQEVRMIVCNSWSNGEQEIDYLKKLESESFLSKEELLFTSTFDSEWCKESEVDIKLGLPRAVVQDLLRLSDLFILPSISECCSMVMLEAAANKNLMILNQDLWSLHEFGGQIMNNSTSKNALYMEFGSCTRPIANYSPSEEEWYANKAQEILDYQNSNQAINFFKTVRKRHNPEWVYFNQIEPLL